MKNAENVYLLFASCQIGDSIVPVEQDSYFSLLNRVVFAANLREILTL